MPTEIPVSRNLFPFSDTSASFTHDRKTKSRKTPELPICLKDKLLPEAKAWIDRVFTPSQQYLIENGLHGVSRMKGIRDKGFPIPSDFIQTNLEHEANILGNAKEIHDTNPALAKSLNFADVQIYAYGHDIPEMLDKVGDVQPTERTKRDQARKRLEYRAAVGFLIPHIESPESRNDALRRYREYVEADPDNLEVQMARYLDQRDGTITYAHLAFNVHEVHSPIIMVKMKLHLYETLPKLIAPAVNLLVGLPTGEARKEMRSIFIGDLRTLEKYAPPGVALPYIERFAA